MRPYDSSITERRGFQILHECLNNMDFNEQFKKSDVLFFETLTLSNSKTERLSIQFWRIKNIFYGLSVDSEIYIYL